MKGKRFKEEQIIRILQEAEAGVAVISQEISQDTHHLRRSTFGDT